MAKYTLRDCDNCNKKYSAKTADIAMGWGLCCSKSCASQKREKSKSTYSAVRVAKNNVRRENWNTSAGGVRGYTSEGYRIVGKTAYNEWDEPVYDI